MLDGNEIWREVSLVANKAIDRHPRDPALYPRYRRAIEEVSNVLGITFDDALMAVHEVVLFERPWPPK